MKWKQCLLFQYQLKYTWAWMWARDESLVCIFWLYLKDCLWSPRYSKSLYFYIRNSLFSSVAVSFGSVLPDNQTLLYFLGPIQNQPLTPDLKIHWFYKKSTLLRSALSYLILTTPSAKVSTIGSWCWFWPFLLLNQFCPVVESFSFSFFYVPLLALPPLLFPCAEIPWRPVPFTRALAASLPGTVLRLAVFLQHALVFPPQLVVAPHPLAVLLHMWQVRRPNQLHDIFEPRAWLANLAWRAAPAVSATGHPGPVASWRPVFEGVRETGAVTCHELVHSLPLEDFESEAGQGLCEAVFSGAADVNTFVLAEETTEQQALLCRHHAIVQLHLSKAEGLHVT